MSNSRRARRQAARHRQPEQSLREWPTYSPQAASVLLRESVAVLDPPDTTVEAIVPTVEVSNRPWSDFSQADYTPAQWRRACLIDTGQGAEDSKERYALPVKEPSGTVNRNGVHAAASRIGQVDTSADKKRSAAGSLVRLYRGELEEDPPESLLALAGMSESHRQPAEIHETVPVAIREAPTGTPLTVDVQLIQAGWNKAGTRYYPPEVLARDVPQVYPAGTHMYLDHPTATEEAELPERSVTRLAAVLAEAPYSPDGGKTMRAKARVFGHHRQFLAEAWRDIGVSINGAGDGHWGERDGRQGQIIEALTHGASIDFVTKAGAGGRILQLLESATDLREARNIGAWLESRLHLALTQMGDEMYGDGRLTRAERITLFGAIGDALQVWTARVETDAPQLFTRDLHEEPEPAPSEVREADPAPAPDPVPVPEPTPETTAPEADPANDADGNPPAAETNQEGSAPMSGENTQTGTAPATAGTVEGQPPEVRAAIAEAQLREAQARISDLTTQNATLTSERDSSRGELSRMRVTEAARAVVAGTLADTDLPDVSRDRVTQEATREVPTTADGQVDTTALAARITEAVERERAHNARVLEAAGAGRPTGLSGQPAGVPDVEPWRTSLVESFKGLGMSDQAAKAAANGR